MRVATVDIGTNTVLLLVADRGADGRLSAVAEHATITRLGEGVDRTRRLSRDAIGRTRDCLTRYADIVRDLRVERTAVVGTSAMRDAGGGEEMKEIVRALFGVEARVLSGQDEARLTFRGAMVGLSDALRLESQQGVRRRVDAELSMAVFDIGGGSTEVVLGRVQGGLAQVDFSASYDVGSVRMTERLLAHDPPRGDELDALAAAARAAFSAVPPLPDGALMPIGVAGTMTTLAAVSLGLSSYDGARVHGHVMPRRELERVVRHVASLDLAARSALPGMEPKRADVIVAGGAIAVALLEHWHADAVRISDRGVRWGLAEEA